ncbi:MAG: hypothetical protein ACTSV2_16310 [Candidatus Thorarchaeota archaeon]
MTEETIDTSEPIDTSDPIDVGGLFRGTATITFLTEIITAIMMLGSGIAYIISRPNGIITELNEDLSVFLLMIAAMITLFFFLGAIGFFLRFNRKIHGIVIGKGIGTVDMKTPRVKTVISIYGLAVGLILIMGMYGYWLAWKYFLSIESATSLSYFIFSLSLGAFILAFLVQIIVIALGRTVTTVIEKVLLK